MIAKANLELAKSPLVREALKFWFADNDHIRSPFPSEVHVAVQSRSVGRFATWLSHLNDKAKDEVNEEILAEKFEEFLFEAGLELVHAEDERITLLYPFLPRTGDAVTASADGQSHAPSVVASRSLTTEGDSKFLQLTMKENGSDQTWETKIELPA